MCKKCEQKLLTKVLIVVVIVATVSVIITTVVSNNYKEQCLLKKNQENSDTLVSVQIVFRHGHRTLDAGKLYRLDPYNNYSFYPENAGELTTNGRKSAYSLGKIIHKRYKEFLNTTEFYPGLVKSFVSGYDRTQMSLQCVHAGLFPNKNSILGIAWRPIPYHVFDFDEDSNIGILRHCKTIIFPPIKPTDDDTIKLFQFMSEKSGEKIETYSDSLLISNAFLVETSYGLELPAWGKSIFPQPLMQIDEIAWHNVARANIRLGAGGMLKLITQNALDATVNNAKAVLPKLILYSGHDYNLLFLRHSLKIPHIDGSTFSAHLIFELHKINGDFGFKIFYNNYKKGHPILLKVPFCESDSHDGSFCKLDTFVKNTVWYYDPQPFCY